jgi:hypothetical protein
MNQARPSPMALMVGGCTITESNRGSGSNRSTGGKTTAGPDDAAGRRAGSGTRSWHSTAVRMRHRTHR